MVKLERCPFCGSLSAYSRMVGEGFSVVCRNRACMAVALHAKAKERDAVGALWNRRGQDRFVSPHAARACPFCGGHAKAMVLTDGAVTMHCTSCGMMVSFVNSQSVTDSVRAWNRRT